MRHLEIPRMEQVWHLGWFLAPQMGPGKGFPAPRMPRYVQVDGGHIPFTSVQPKSRYQKSCPRARGVGKFKLYG